MHSFTKTRDSRMIDLTATSAARASVRNSVGGSASEGSKDSLEKKCEQTVTTEKREAVEKSDAQAQTPDLLPRAPWLAGPGPIDCIVLRLPNTELFAHRVTFCIQRHGLRTASLDVVSRTEITPCIEALRKNRETLYAVIVDEKTQAEELIGVQFLLRKDNVLRFFELREGTNQMAEDFAKLKDSPANRQRIIKFFLDPMMNAIEPSLEDFNYFKNYLKRGLRDGSKIPDV